MTALPLYDIVEHGRDSYVFRTVLPSLIPIASRYWRINGRTCSVQLGRGMVKAYNGFVEHNENAETFTSFLYDCSHAGITRPSSYSDMFSQTWRSPWIKPSASALLADYFCGGWQEAKAYGMLKGKWNKYDLNSAYFWSLLQGLPDPLTYRYSEKPDYSDVRGYMRQGVYVVSLSNFSRRWPYPFNQPHLRYLASTEEIERYGLPIKEFHYGVTWDGVIDTTAMAAHIRGLPATKQVARSFWGSWASLARIRCYSRSRAGGWDLPAVRTNLVWAHTIISRVKMRVWEYACNAAHIYVDSIITPDTITTGDGPGEWRLQHTYPNGLFVQGTGWYGPTPGNWDSHTGIKKAATVLPA